MKAEKQRPEKECMICKEPFVPFRTTQRTCTDPKCMLELARRRRQKKLEREARARLREGRSKLKTRSDWVREAQTAFNAFIRARDAGLPCISCGRQHAGQMHAGHYRTTKAEPAIRFHPLNCWIQCAPCNNHLSGNVAEYRINLRQKIGDSLLDWLEGPHQPQRWSIEDLIEIKGYYREALRALRREE